MQSAIELRGIRGSLEDLAFGANNVAASIQNLEGELGLRLDAQTHLLGNQVALLAQIHQTLLTPAKTRAAERLTDVAELLRRGRWERALALAEEAIHDDPNNPAAFTAAGWALLGLKRLPDAKKQFVETAQASDGDTRSRAARQAARLSFAISGPEEALRVLGLAVHDQTGETERHAVAYDTAIYRAEANEIEKAMESLLEAIQDDDRYCLMALNDDLLARHAPLITCAADVLNALISDIKQERRSTEGALSRSVDLLDGAKGAARPFRRQQERLALLELVAQQRERLSEIRASNYPSLRRVLEVVQGAHNEADALAARVSQWRADEAARDERDRVGRELIEKRDRLLDEAIANLHESEGAEVEYRSDNYATLKSRRWGGLVDQMWGIHIDEDFQVIVNKDLL